MIDQSEDVMMPQRNEYADLISVIQSTITPMVNKLQVLEDKVDKLNQDRATRSDLEKLHEQFRLTFVPRDSYEPRHASLIERNAQIESTIRELRKDVDADLQKIHDRLESGKQQIEERIKQQQERPWMRVQQLAGVVAVVLVIVDWLFQHVKFP